MVMERSSDGQQRPSTSDTHSAVASPERVLALIETEADAAAIVEHLLQCDPRGDGAAIVLLNTQPKPDPIATRGLFKHEIRSRLEMVGRQLLASAADALTRVGFACETRVEFVDDESDVLAIAHEMGSSRIIVATSPLGAAGKLWLRMTGCTGAGAASRLAALSDLPVVVLKRGRQ